MGRPEDSRVKIPALVHFTRLGYTYMSIKDKERNVDYDGDTNIFYSQFLSAVNRINQTELTLEDAKKIIGELKIKLDNDDLGKSFFKILQSGIDGIKLIDFSDITGTKNDYTVVTELPYENGDDNFRPDIVVLINGIPLSFIEVKRQNNREGILTERSRMERRFSNKIYRRFVGITQFTVFSNNNEYDDSDIEPIQGAFYASSSYKRMFFSKFREQREDELKADMKPIVTETEEFVLSDNNLIANRMKIGGIELRLREMGKKLNIEKIHPHKFRRTLATVAIDKGMPIEQLQKLLGHQRIDTTLQYAMVKQSNVKIAHRKYIG